jgi:LysM repeat protein
MEEERNEPRVEIGPPDESPLPISNKGRRSSGGWKKIGLGLLVLLGGGGLVFGVWSGLTNRNPSSGGTVLPAEVLSLKQDLARLDQEVAVLKKEIQALKETGKDMNESVRGLKEQREPSPPAPTLSKPSAKAHISSKPLVYRVRKGDTLASVARKFKTTPKELRRWNHLGADESPPPGRLIIVRPANP